MKIHSKPLNYLSAATSPADSAAAPPDQVIVYLSDWGRGDCLKDDSRITTMYSREDYRLCYLHQNSEQIHTFRYFRPTFWGLFAASGHPCTEITLWLDNFRHNSVLLWKKELSQRLVEIRSTQYKILLTERLKYSYKPSYVSKHNTLHPVT
jgi:hypothetical protein